MHDYYPTQPGYQHEAGGFGSEQEAYFGGYGGTGAAVPLQPAQEMELAVELLEVGNEYELEHFLDNVFSAVGDAIGRFVKSDTGQALGGILKDAAKRALPVARKAVGDWLGPQQHEFGPNLAAEAGSLLGLELEGLSAEDQEFEAARQFVRFASSAAQQAALAPPTMPPDVAAGQAATVAAQSHAPGLAHEVVVRDHRGGSTSGYSSRPSSGSIVRDHRGTSTTAYGTVVRDHRGTGADRQPWTARPAFRWAPTYPVRTWARPVGYGSWGYRAPTAHRAWRGFGGSPWQGSGAWPSRGYYGGYRPGYGPANEWSRVRVWLGDGPPQAPPGAPGRWVYRGYRHGRRRWAWVPYRESEPYAMPPDDDQAYAAEPPPPPPPAEPPPVAMPMDPAAFAQQPGPPVTAMPADPSAPAFPPAGVQVLQNGGPPAAPGSGEIGRW